MKIWLLPNLYSIINIEGVELALDSYVEPYKTVMRRWQKIVVPGSKWGRLFFVVFIEEFVAEPNQGNDKSAKSQDKPYHSFSLNPAYVLSHVVLDSQRDMALSNMTIFPHLTSPY